jgi:hypothetical protein
MSLLLSESASAASPPLTAAGVATLARTLQGKTLAQLQSQDMVDGPWHSYQGDWCAVFGSWLTRGAGVPYVTVASGLYAAGTPVSAPAMGDIIHYANNGHVGIVVDVVNGVPRTIEGNTHTHPWQYATVSLFNQPWAGGTRFSRPNYSNSEPPTSPPLPEEEDDMRWYLRPDGTQTIAGTFSWVDYGIPERAQIVGTLLCNQTAPISISMHQWNILHEEYLIRVGQYKTAFPGTA